MRENRASPTLEDVARAAGVSTATVSRALNCPDKVARPTREKVQQAVHQLGYLPHFGARAMAANRTRTIGAIIPTMENAIFARGIQAFQEALHERGYTLLVASSSYSAALEEEQVRALVARGADGLLLIGHDRDPAVTGFLERHRVATLVSWSFDPAARLPSVGFDNIAAMQALAREALALGHRRLALVTAPLATNDRARGRAEGVRRAMREVGLAPETLLIVETVYGLETGAAAFRKVMAAPEPPTMVFCGNDVLAMGALMAARDAGLDVPGDVSVTGFDDIDLASVAVPGLTTVHVPHRLMGATAARSIIAMVEEDLAGESLQLKTDLRWRESLAPPPTTRGG